MGVRSDAQSIFASRCFGCVLVSCGYCRGTGAGKDRRAGGFHYANDRPVTGMENRVQPENFAGRQARGLRSPEANWEDNAFDRNLWIVDIATGESHALTSAKKSSTNAAWSPDEKWIAFLSDRPGQIKDTPEGKKQLYVISA